MAIGTPASDRLLKSSASSTCSASASASAVRTSRKAMSDGSVRCRWSRWSAITWVAEVSPRRTARAICFAVAPTQDSVIAKTSEGCRSSMDAPTERAMLGHMSVTPPGGRRDWTVPIIVVAIGIVVVLGLCVIGGVAAFVAFRNAKPVAQASAVPSASPAPAVSKAPQECLIGDWLEVSYTGDAEIYGIKVQLSGKGTATRFAPDGTVTTVFDNVVVSGSAQGSRYEVTHNGSLTMHYLADATTINYSSPQANGTTTWKVDGKQTDQEQMHASLKPETYRCQGNDLRLFGPDYASELQRIAPPGMPA
jgi:hypothetical protein